MYVEREKMPFFKLVSESFRGAAWLNAKSNRKTKVFCQPIPKGWYLYDGTVLGLAQEQRGILFKKKDKSMFEAETVPELEI